MPTALMQQIAEVTNMAGLTDAEQAAMIASLINAAAAAAPAGGAVQPAPVSTPAPSVSPASPTPTGATTAATTATNPVLNTLVNAYMFPNSPAVVAFPDTGNPAGLPSFNPSEPPYVFANAGPQAISAIFTGPGLKRAVCDAAGTIAMHGTAPVAGAQAVTAPVIAAVAAYVAANPTQVPVSGPGVAALPIGAPSLYGTPAVLTPAQIAAAQAFDSNIDAQDAGKGSVPISSITAADLQYAALVLGGNIGGFLRSYTSDPNVAINQTINAYSAGGPQAGQQGVTPTGSAKITAAVAAYQAATAAAQKAKKVK